MITVIYGIRSRRPPPSKNKYFQEDDGETESSGGFFSMTKFHKAYMGWKLKKGLIDRETYLAQTTPLETHRQSPALKRLADIRYSH